MTEQIGKITLDYTHYPGEDFYCDGTIEDTLLSIVKNNPPSEFQKIIEQRAEWPILYHLSPLRENIVSWLPIDKEAKVLEVGSGCGAITGALAAKAGSVTCIELSKKRSHINAYRHKDCENVTIQVGNFQDIEPELPKDYDYVLLIGVFEYGKSYIATQTPYEDFLGILKKHVKPGGKLIIAIENKFGLKYWAGCKEDHYGDYFSGLEDYPKEGGVRTFTRQGLENIFAANGITEYSFYYPYPDYKFMTSVYSDRYLPKIGELGDNIRNFDRDRLLLFDEKNVFNTIIREGLFPLYANSYLVVIGKEPETKYVKYSNDRQERFAIRTEIAMNQAGVPYVKKVPMTEKAFPHIARMEDAYKLLENRFTGGELSWNICEKKENELIFEYLYGMTLEEVLDELLNQNDRESYLAFFKEYVRRIDFRNEIDIVNYDLAFGNIIINGDDWQVIDYEWTYQERIPAYELAYRAYYCYTLGSPKRKQIKEEEILAILGITKETAAQIREKEAEFQKYVTGERLAMAEIRNKIGYRLIPAVMQEEPEGSSLQNRIQIYENTGNGFSEEESYFAVNIVQEEVTVELEVGAEVRELRLDPVMYPCMVEIKEILWNNREEKLISEKFSSNGVKAADKVYVFATEDPHFTFRLQKIGRNDKNIMKLVMRIVKLPKEMAEKFKTKKFLV